MWYYLDIFGGGRKIIMRRAVLLEGYHSIWVNVGSNISCMQLYVYIEKIPIFKLFKIITPCFLKFFITLLFWALRVSTTNVNFTPPISSVSHPRIYLQAKKQTNKQSKSPHFVLYVTTLRKQMELSKVRSIESNGDNCYVLQWCY